MGQRSFYSKIVDNIRNMKEHLKLHVCHECGMQFLFSVDMTHHEAETGHRLFTIMHMPEDTETKVDRFNPTVNTLCRIMKALVEQNSINRTALSTVANVHYSRLSKCLELLQERKLIELIIEDGIVLVHLTEGGKEFASRLSDLEI